MHDPCFLFLSDILFGHDDGGDYPRCFVKPLGFNSSWVLVVQDTPRKVDARPRKYPGTLHHPSGQLSLAIADQYIDWKGRLPILEHCETRFIHVLGNHANGV